MSKITGDATPDKEWETRSITNASKFKQVLDSEKRDQLYRYEYEVVNMKCGDDAASVINDYARNGWRLHTYSQGALDRGAFAAGFMKAFGGPGLALVNVLTLVFERDRRDN
jgi:hypothetical protein